SPVTHSATSDARELAARPAVSERPRRSSPRGAHRNVDTRNTCANRMTDLDPPTRRGSSLESPRWLSIRTPAVAKIRRNKKFPLTASCDGATSRGHAVGVRGGKCRYGEELELQGGWVVMHRARHGHVSRHSSLLGRRQRAGRHPGPL